MLMLAVTLCSVFALAQSSITVSANVLETEPRGGFKYSKYEETYNLRLSIGYERRASKRYGYFANLATGNKWMWYVYPVFSTCGNPADPEICVFPERRSQDQVFRFVETSFGGTVFLLGRILRVRVGPYIAFNGIASNQVPFFGVDEQLYFPSAAADVFSRFEFGGHGQVALVLPLGKHWSIQANGFLARSFSDLRKDKWVDARAVLFGPQEAYVAMESERLTLFYRSYGLSVGYTW